MQSRSRILRLLPLTALTIFFTSVSSLPQQRSSRELAGIHGQVRTVRIEGQQLKAVTYHQWGVMVYTIIYDDEGRVLEEAEYLPGGNPDLKTTWVYDALGNEIESAKYTHDELTRRVTTRYDTSNRKIEQLTFDAKGKQINKFIFKFNARQRQIAFEVLPDGTSLRRWVAVLDHRGNQLERIEYGQGGIVEDRYVYAYDAHGNKTSETHYYKDEGAPRSSRETYLYDSKGNLIEKARYFDRILSYKESFKRDERGNPLERIEIDRKGRITVKRNWSYEFDAVGNWTKAVISEWTSKAPEFPMQPTYEYRRIFGWVNSATIALWSAAREGNTEVAQKLLEQGADVNASHPDGGTSLIKAAARGHHDTVRALITAGARVDGKDAEGWTALAWAAEFGRIEIVKMLLAAGADPNSRNELAGVPIMTAALNGHIEVLKLLLGEGAQVNAAAGDGSTALMVSAGKGQTEVVRLLLTEGADPSLETSYRTTAVHYAAAGNNVNTVRAILDTGVDVNAKSADGTTPLMVAAERSEAAILEFLIKRGADINAKNAAGKTALIIALEASNKEAAELLTRAGAK